jgi:hypothetical protein
LAIVFFHQNLFQVQLILCINSILVFVVHLCLAYKKSTYDYLRPSRPEVC